MYLNLFIDFFLSSQNQDLLLFLNLLCALDLEDGLVVAPRLRSLVNQLLEIEDHGMLANPAVKVFVSYRDRFWSCIVRIFITRLEFFIILINLFDMSEHQIIDVAAQLTQNETFETLGNVADHKASFFFLVCGVLFSLPVHTHADILRNF